MMRMTPCSQEEAVIRSMGRGELSEMAQHIRSCAHCAELVRSSEWMRTFANRVEQPRLPDADLIWVQAKMSEGRTNPRASAVHTVLEMFPVAIALACAGVLVADWQKIQKVVRLLIPANVGNAVSGPLASLGAIILIASVILI